VVFVKLDEHSSPGVVRLRLREARRALAADQRT
jgi:hypothetical protein